MKQLILLAFILSFCCAQSLGQTSSAGPIINDFGKVYYVPEPDFETDTTLQYKVIFDIYGAPDDPTKINAQINTLARFLNMHSQAGVPKENLKVACVFHNKATWQVSNDEQYKAKYGVPNPNLPLLVQLAAAGAEIFICGQSVYARGLDRQKMVDPVQVGLSAMTIILSYQQKGYQLIKF